MNAVTFESNVKPLCFMIMPFGTKLTYVKQNSGPSKVNFDALWHLALEPAIEKPGYLPVRADFDLGAMIIIEMLERLTLADLVIADLTIPNGIIMKLAFDTPRRNTDAC